MTLQRLFTPAAIALTIAMTAAPALAESGGQEGQQQSRDRGARTTQSGSQNRGARGDVAVRRSTPRTDTGRASRVGQSNRTSDGRGYTARQNDGRGYTAPQNYSRGYTARQNDSRGYTAPQNYSRGYTARQNDSRGYTARRNNSPGYDGRRDTSRSYSTSSYGRGGGHDRNSWRSFIRFGLGLSIFAGDPFGYRFDHRWRPGFDYRYQMRQGVAYGGMSFLLSPDYAEVYIDGVFVGVARDFGGQPVPVAVGYHRIELYAQGFEPVAFDINVLPGQVIPYRGSLSQVY